MGRLGSLVLLLALVVAACGGGGDDESAETDTGAQAPEWDAPGEADPNASGGETLAGDDPPSDDVGEVPVVRAGIQLLNAVGIDTGSGVLTFGTPTEVVISEVTSLLGPPTADTGLIPTIENGCPTAAESFRTVNWGSLELVFMSESDFMLEGGDHLVFWFNPGTEVDALSFVGDSTQVPIVNDVTTVGELTSALGDSVSVFDEELLGPSFLINDNFGEMRGELSGLTDTDLVLSANAGIGCGEWAAQVVRPSAGLGGGDRGEEVREEPGQVGHLGPAVVDHRWTDQLGRLGREHEATAHLAAPGGAADGVDQGSHLVTVIRVGDRAEHDGAVAGGIEGRLVEPDRGRVGEGDGEPRGDGTDVLVDPRRVADVALAIGQALDVRQVEAGLGEEVGLWVPELVALGLGQVPPEPPVDHLGCGARPRRPDGDPELTARAPGHAGLEREVPGLEQVAQLVEAHAGHVVTHARVHRGEHCLREVSDVPIEEAAGEVVVFVAPDPEMRRPIGIEGGLELGAAFRIHQPFTLPGGCRLRWS